MSEELKRCPFCGEMPETDGRFAQCYLMPCDARHFIMPLKSWQKRPIEDALNKRIAELEHDLSNKEIEYTDLWDDMLEMQSRIAELKDFIDQLIEVGHKSANFVEGFCNTYGNERPDYWHDWRKLEDDWKEREE